MLSVRGATLPACKVGREVRNWAAVNAGDEVRATIREVLTVYVAPPDDGRSHDPGARSQSVDARVLVMDPSYRLVTVQYPNGGTETFKLGLHTRMEQIAAGDSVAIRPVEAIELHVRHHANRREGAHSGQSVTTAR